MFYTKTSKRFAALWKRKVPIFTFTTLVVFMVIFILPIRNYCFQFAMHKAWQDIPTYDLIKIHYFSEPTRPFIMQKVVCDIFHETKLQVKDIDENLFTKYPKLNSDEAKQTVLLNGQGRFLPVLTKEQKIETLYIYKVVAEVLNEAKIQFFLQDGNLLGLMRHRGFVPWDDDIDISLSVQDWEQAKNILSCIVGFTFIPVNSFHWKLYHTDQSFPFLDIFFYDNDDNYVWALTYYTRFTFIYPTHLVFPLTYANLEGVKVPVPRDSLAIVKKIYNYNICQVYNGHGKNMSHNSQQLSEGYRVRRIPCSDLQYMFDMYHLDNNM